MKILCVFGQHNYGDPARGQGYEYSNFLPALHNLGHEVAVFDSFSRANHADFAALNRALLETVERFRPELVFCVLMGYEVWLETLDLIRKSGAHLINWGTDDSWKYNQFSRFVAPVFDLWATTSYAAWQAAERDGYNNFSLSQWAASAGRLSEPLPARDCRYPVSFVGSAYGNRPRWVAELKTRGIEVACFGYGWSTGPVSAEDIPHIVRESVVSLNFGDSGVHFRGLRLYRSRQIKARVFEVPGAGGCLLTEPAEHLEKYYVPGREIEVFSNVDELAEKLRYLLANPGQRDAMAWAGYRRTRADHTYEARFEKLLARLPAGVTRLPVDTAAFDAICASHRSGPGARLLRKLLSAPCQMVWGAHRGPRAARRILFELSWRLAGRRTYTARGLPGRLFYRES